jgi:putative addiction module component (TIGR02574 family)
LVIPSSRVTHILQLASVLDAEERLQIAEELWNASEAETLDPDWAAELRRRVVDMKTAQVRGEPDGLRLTFDELRKLVSKQAADDE